MKKFGLTRILILVLSFALLVGAVLCISASAADSDNKGKFGSISVAYGDKVAIQVAVDATKEEIDNGDVVVTYTINEATANAVYYRTDDQGRVWVITEGIAAYDLAQEVVFSSYVNGEQVEADRTYSVAQFIYKMLYTNGGITEEYKNLYESLLAYGEAAQIALNKNADKLVTDSTLVYTNNSDVVINGNSFAFAPAAGLTNVAPVYGASVPVGKELIGWNIVDNGVEKAEDLTFDCNGVVEVLSPIFADLDPTPFTLQNGGFENGLEGWVVVGNIGNVSSDTHYWLGDRESAEGFAFGMDGANMFSAYAPGAEERAVGTLTSSTFIVGGSGYVTFKVGAMKDANYVYVDVVDAETKEILVRYSNSLWAERTNDVKSGCTLVAYKADLSEFMGRSVFFRVSDNAASDYGLFFLDSVNTYYTSEPEGFNDATPVNYAVSGTIYDVFNGGFELGDNRGWWNDQEIGVVTNANAFWQDNIPYEKDGDYLFTGVESFGADTMREANTGFLTSSAFELGGTGYISFMLGGGENDLCYVQVIDAATGEVLARYHQQAMNKAVLIQYVADLSAYVGKTVRIQIVDNATSGWGCVSFDNVVTYYPEGKALPEGITANDIKYEIVNGSFESGNLNGWKMNVTWSGDGLNTLGWVVNTEIDVGWYTKNDDRKDGEFLFTFAQGDNNCENNTGTLESSTFVLKKDSFVSFRFGGAGTHGVRIELCNANGEVIATFYNDAEGKVDTEMYAYYYQYTGEATECYFRIVDEQREGDSYRCFVVDDFRVNLEAAPEGFIPAIQ